MGGLPILLILSTITCVVGVVAVVALFFFEKSGRLVCDNETESVVVHLQQGSVVSGLLLLLFGVVFFRLDDDPTPIPAVLMVPLDLN